MYAAKRELKSVNSNEKLEKLINALTSKNEAALVKAGSELKAYVEAESRELSDEKLASFQDQIMIKIHELFHTDARLGGIVGVSYLVDLEYMDNTKMVTRLASYIHKCLPCDSVQQVRLAARLMGRLAVIGGNVTHDFAEAEIRRSLEWLSLPKDYDNKRYASVLMLKELVENAPQLAYPRVESILNNIWNPLRDPNQHIWEAAAQALSSVLDLIGTREYEHRRKWYKYLFQMSMRGIENRLTESGLHASLLALQEQVNHHGRRARRTKERADGTRAAAARVGPPQIAEERQDDFMLEHFQLVGQKVLSLMDHRSPLIRLKVTEMLPCLARFHPEAFCHFYLSESIGFLLGSISAAATAPVERAAALLALGGLAEVTGRAFAQAEKPPKETAPSPPPAPEKLILTVLATLKGLLVPRRAGPRDRPARDDGQAETLACFAKIVKSCAEEEVVSLCANETLTQICSLGLSPELCQVLTDITNTLPYTLKRVQKHLLQQATAILAPPAVVPLDRSRRAGAVEVEAADPEDKLIALEVAGTFNFQGNLTLMAFVRQTAVTYLTDPSPLLRKAAARACCHLVAQALDSAPHLKTRPRTPTTTAPPPPLSPAQAPSAPGQSPSSNLKPSDRQFMPRLLCNLLAVAVSDVDPEIRMVVLGALEARFDPFLCSPECLRLLFMCLNDEVLPNRHAAIDILGRVNRRNPAYIHTSFRVVLLQLINALEYTQDARKEEESALLLSKVIRAAPALIPPYAARILEVLVKKLGDATVPAVTGTLLSTLGELSIVCGASLSDTPRLLPLVIEILMDQSSWVKRIHALRALGNIVVSTGNVISPYTSYPQLLPFLLKALMPDQKVDWESRREIMKLVGIVGAIDPYRHKQIQLQYHEETEQKSKDSQKSRPFGLKGGVIPFSRLTALMEEYYPTVVINCLLSILSDESLAEHHQFAMAGFLPIFRALGIPKCLPYLPPVLPRLLKIAETDNLVLREYSLGQITGLLNYVKQHAIGFMEDLFRLVQNFAHTPEESTLIPTLSLVEEMRVAFHEDFPQFLPWLIPWLVRLVKENYADTRKLSIKVFHCFEVLGEMCEHYLNFVIPCLVETLADSQIGETVAAYQCRTAACNTLCNLSRMLDTRPYVCRIIHPLFRTLVETASAAGPATPAIGIGSVASAAAANAAVGLHHVKDGLEHVMQPPGFHPPGPTAVSGPVATAMNQLHEGATSLLCHVVHGMGPSALRYCKMLQVAVKTHRLNSLVIDILISKVLNGELLDPDTVLELARPHAAVPHSPLTIKIPPVLPVSFALSSGLSNLEEASEGPPPVNATNLTAIYEFSRVTEEDWIAWNNQLALELIRQSPSTAIRHCFQLAALYLPLARELFNAAFVSCYNNLKDGDQVQLLTAVSQALDCRNVPISVLQTLLNFTEFLEHQVTLTGNGAAIFARARQRAADPEMDPDPVSRLLKKLKSLPVHPHATGGDLPAGLPSVAGVAAEDIFDIGVLARNALNCHLYAKALRYKEIQFLKLVEGHRRVHSPQPPQAAQIDPALVKATEDPHVWLQICQELIDCNHRLDLPESSIGKIRFCQNNLQPLGIASVDQFLAGAGDVLEKLNRWDESLKVYERRLEQDHKSIDNLLGVMRSLRAMGEWGRLIQVCEDKWRSADDYTRQLLAPMAGHAAWILSKWNFLAKTNEYMDQAADPIACFLSAVLSVHQGEFQKASTLVHQCRKLLAPSLAAYVSESYDRAYYSVVQLQQLSEVEEVISFKKALELADQARAEDGGLQKKATDLEERREQLRSVWGLRLKGMQLHVQYWEEVLAVQSLALTPHENMNSWLKFSNLARQAGKPKLAQTTLINLLTPELIQSFQTGAFKPSVLLTAKDALPQVVCAYFEHMWGVGEKTEAMALMAEYVTKLHLTGPPGLNALKAQGYLTLGKWQQQLQKDCCSNEGRRKLILQNLQLATQLDPQSYKAWHAWALFNQKIAERLQKKKAHPALLLQFLVCAIRGFVQSIYLCSADISMSVQDLLRLLTIWFNNGTLEEVAAEVNAGITKISVEAWLLVIPQIIARLQSPIPSVSEGVSLLLTRIGQAHPQALIYPVTVAAKDTGAGVAILESMKEHSPSLVAQASLVSDELIRIAILWLDQWCEGIEQANKAYFVGNGSTSADGMMAVLEPLHSMMQNPETETEKEFLHQFGADLMEAHNWCKQYRSSRKQTDMNKAWDLYYHVFRRLNKFIAMTTLQLASVAPRLMSCRDLDLAIPGQYRAGETPPCIRSFAPTLQVIQSKQRPRKLTIHGSDGNEYSFLLKGHEDLRQDQRVMQLFGLVNNFFLYDLETARRDLSIEKYPVVPLSSNVGIIGWLEHAETFHNLLVEYRKAKKIHLTLEHKLMTQMTADYDNLALMQKVEVFEYALENTDGQDLNRVLWLKSPSSQVWLDRRTCYTRSLATMSMVGYILGLGDRHPSNITLDRLTNKVVHIDFGDCFEVAQHREKYPERVPFRLTRMLVNAMEASGIDGTFYTTCERVMKVLRKNKDSLMAMLEAFVHDPLIAWRLAGAVGSAGDHTVANTTTAVVKPTPLTDYDFVFAGDATDLVATSELYSRTTRERMLYSASLMQSAENTNKKALEVVTRIKRKLEGTEFAPHIHLPGKRHSQPAAAPAHTQQRPTGAPEKEKEKEREAPPAPPRPPSPPGPGAEAATSSGGGAGRAAKAKAKGRPRPRSAGPAGDEPRSPSSISSKSSDPKSPASRSSSASSRSSGPFSSSAASTTTLEVASWDEQADGKASSPGSPGAADANGEQGSPVTKAASAASPSAKATAQPPGQDHEGDGAARPNGPSSVPTGKAIVAAAGVAGSVAAEGGERRDEAAEGGEAHAADRPLEGGVSVAEQIQRLIEQATSHQNLCQCYIGWCPFW